MIGVDNGSDFKSATFGAPAGTRAFESSFDRQAGRTMAVTSNG